eukprot:357881-Chlamydomonas_euryale.AAC.15
MPITCLCSFTTSHFRALQCLSCCVESLHGDSGRHISQRYNVVEADDLTFSANAWPMFIRPFRGN